jgi:hypothetical protein
MKEALPEADRLSDIFRPFEPAEKSLSIVVQALGECVTSRVDCC